MQHSIFPLFDSFNSISLDKLNEKAPLLHRNDNKYVLNSEQLIQLLEHCKNRFDVLEINQKICFTYQNQYFDTDDLLTFKHHNQGKRKRIKVRRRYYMDSQLAFFEVKLKGFRDKTHKYRLPIHSELLDKELTTDEKLFLEEKYFSHYAHHWEYELTSSLNVTYQRIALVGKQSKERITIDNKISFSCSTDKKTLPQEYWIVEVKSELGKSQIDRWLLSKGIRPSKKCAKYCIGVSLLSYRHNNRFRPIAKQLTNYQP